MGAGAKPCSIAIVGEHPNNEEDSRGIPLLGDTGSLISTMLETAGISKEEVYATNTLACKVRDGGMPSRVQLNTCQPRLFRELYLAEPLIIIALGQSVTSRLVGKGITIDEWLGKPVILDLPGTDAKWRTVILSTLDPVTVLSQRNQETMERLAAQMFSHFCLAADMLDNLRKLTKEKDDAR